MVLPFGSWPGASLGFGLEEEGGGLEASDLDAGGCGLEPTRGLDPAAGLAPLPTCLAPTPLLIPVDDNVGLAPFVSGLLDDEGLEVTDA